MGLNRNQFFAISVAILAVLMASTAQLNDLFGPQVAKTIISTAGLLNGVLGSILAVLTGQNAIIQQATDIAKDQNSPLKALVMADTPEGRALAKAEPTNAVVAAGSVFAAEVAKSGT